MVAFDHFDRADIVVVAGHQQTIETKPFVGESRRQPQDLRPVALSPELGHDGVADMTADAQEEVVEQVPKLARGLAMVEVTRLASIVKALTNTVVQATCRAIQFPFQCV